MSFYRGLKLAGFARRHLGKMSRGRGDVMRHLEGDAPLPMPTFVQFRVTNVCNLRCRMCGQWGETGIYRPGEGDAATDGREERNRIRELVGMKRQMGLSSWVRLLDEIAEWSPIVTLYGGEPLLYPDILPLAREIKKRGLTCTMITNGWDLEEMAGPLVDTGIDAIAVSIDGPPAVHDRIRGREGSFSRVAAGVRALARERDRRRSAVPMLLAIFPVTELNLPDAAPALEALRELPLDTINVGLRWFVGKEAGAEYEEVMRRELGVSGDSWKGFAFEGADFAAVRREQLTGLSKLLARARRRRFVDASLGRPWISFVPDVPAAGVPDYFAEPGKTFGHDLCPVAWYFAQVEPDGQVCFCGDFPDYFLGSVLETSFREVWTGERAQRFRDKLAKEPLPICSRCCGSWVYGAWRRPAGRSLDHSRSENGRIE
jgi:MoaA/NifB/PqqE/SkfB family radical SAM enzyme